MSIKSFANQMTADVAAGRNTRDARRIPQRIWTVAQRKLDTLDAATSTHDLAALPGNRFEDLKHTRPGFYSIRINDQLRLCFVWKEPDAIEVEIADYH
jgi:proteic killer suppression protein